ncbi:MAG: Lrp/AsnC family transcriptional regulator [Candidatus Odinarchaeia archaeon]
MTVVFMLIEVETGRIHDVLEKLKLVEGIKEIFAITGPYDIIVKVSAKDMETVKGIVEKIHGIEGIVRTLSSIVLPF